MRVLALETSGIGASAALLEGPELLAELAIPAGSRSAQMLAPTIEILLARAGWKMSAVELFAVTSGPGSFTSLRIGISTAKALAYAVGADIIGVHTLEAIARQAPEDPAAVKAVIDAQREQLFAAALIREAVGETSHGSGARFRPWSTEVVDNGAWLAGLTADDVVSGPGLRRLADRLPGGVSVVNSQFWQPTAATVGRIGWEQFAAGRRDDVFQLVPQYFRRTAAEEQWLRRQADLAGAGEALPELP